MANKFNIEDFKQKINSFFPEWEYKILSFSGYKQPAIVKCLNCGKIHNYKKASDISRKINVCECYHYFNDYHDKLQYFSEKYNFTILKDDNAVSKKRIQCNNCGCIMERSLVSLLNTPDHCDQCHKYREGISHYTKEEIQQRLDNIFNNEYELIEYQGMTKPALLKHKNCGYIFKIREIGDLFEGRNRGCPKCYAFKSAGEQRIRNFLDNYQIEYIPQKTFAPLNKSKYRFDFYLPQYNIAIEYQGEQHYRDNSWFKDNYDTIHKRDLIKKEYCLNNSIILIEIKYTELKNIEAVLFERLNDYNVELNNSKRI